MPATGKADATNVSVGKPISAGAIFTAPAKTALPTDAKTPLDKAYKCLGYAAEDGLTNSLSEDFEDIKAWGGDVVITTRTSRKETFKFKLIETNVEVLKTVYGEKNVTGDFDAGMTVKHNAVDKPVQPWVFEIALTGDRVKRIVVPNGKLASLSDITYKDGEVIGYELEINTFPDENGNTAIEYLAKTAAA